MTELLWIDVETTGLNPRVDALLEIALLRSTTAAPFDTKFCYQAELEWDGDPSRLHPAVQAMHARTGLFDRCRKSIVTARTLDSVLCEHTPRNDADPPIIAGSSAHFDLAFLRENCPDFASRLSHRVYDVSAVKLFCQSLGMPKLPRGEAHTALEDIRESVAHAKACASWLREEYGR